jgi:hypothetical protein
MNEWEKLLKKIYIRSGKNIKNIPIKDIQYEDKGSFYDDFNILQDLNYVEYKNPTYMNRVEIKLTKEGLFYCQKKLDYFKRFKNITYKIFKSIINRKID